MKPGACIGVQEAHFSKSGRRVMPEGQGDEVFVPTRSDHEDP